MKITFNLILSLIVVMAVCIMAHAQGVKMGEVLIVSSSKLKKDVNPETFRTYINNEVTPFLKKSKSPGVVQLFKADRGKGKGENLLVFIAPTVADRKALTHGSPFADNVISKSKSKRPSDFLTNTHTYTEYRLIGADKFQSMPVAGILGIHYIKVKKDRAAEFEKFVVDKLHPAVAQILPDMELLYYKAVAGENAGSYITVFTLESVAARDKYWPLGKPETEILKLAFRPHQELAKELGTYLVEGSYLEPSSGGAAAYYESKEWTDFVHPQFLK